MPNPIRSRIADAVARDAAVSKVIKFTGGGPVLCLVCGAVVGTMTNYHAGTHGYDSKADMVAVGMVRELR